MRLIDADAIFNDCIYSDKTFERDMKIFIDSFPTIDAVPVVRCKDCIHKPQENAKHFAVFPDETCPCRSDDPWYSWVPQDNFYCAYGERREE